MQEPEFQSVGKPVHNQDVAPRSCEEDSSIQCLTCNKPIWKAFDEFESKAVKLKAHYSRLGKLCVSFIGLSALYASLRWAAADLVWHTSLDYVAVAVGLIGLGLDIYLRFTNKKELWLLNRFAAERIRSIKFQAYVYAATERTQKGLQQKASEFTRLAIENLEKELLLPKAALGGFNPANAVHVDDDLAAKAEQADVVRQTLREAIRDYSTWRTKYQHDFANNMKGELVGRSRIYSSLADGLFFLGAIAIVATLLARVILAGDAGSEALLDWMEAIGLGLFIGTAVVGVLTVGAAHKLDESRYDQYERDTAALLEKEPQSASEFVRLVREMELLALRELDDFWRDSWLSSYL